MERKDRLKILEGIISGETTAADIRKKTVRFILPGNGRDEVPCDWKIITSYGTKTYTHEQFLKLKISHSMNREEIIKRLQAIQAGGIGAIARPLPRVWAKRYPKDELVRQVKLIYGDKSKLLSQKRRPYVISDQMVCWHFFTIEDELVRYGHGEQEQVFTQDEYKSIIADLEEENNKWVEMKTYTRVINWVHQPSNHPLEEQPENISKPEPSPPPVVNEARKPVVVIEHEVEDMIELEPAPDQPETIRLSTWVPNKDRDEDRREKMDQWKNLNREFL